jgi:transcription termination factor NusB
MEALIPIIVAIIGGPVVVILQKLRKENTSQHAESRQLLNIVVDKVEKVDNKLDGHITWHLDKEKK